MEITVLKEQARGCGYRKSGKDGVGLYLVGGGIMEPCERLPFPLDICPCCSAGIKFSRGFTWITPSKLFDPKLEPKCDPNQLKNHHHAACCMCNPPADRHGLLWVGEKFYTPSSFNQEAAHRGVSKRIPTLPHGFEFGSTLVYLAHKKAVTVTNDEGEIDHTPGVILAFRPVKLEIVVDTTNPEELPSRAKSIAEKLGDNARIVKIEPLFEQQEFTNFNDDNEE